MRLSGRPFGLALLAGIALQSPGRVLAAPISDARIVIHLTAPTGKNACVRPEATPDCPGVKTAGGLFPRSYFAYIIVTNADSLAGVQLGLRYDPAPHSGVDVIAWTNCATLEFPSTEWPASGGGNLITWDAASRCQTSQPHGATAGVEAVAGYLYCTAYGPDTLWVTPRPIDGFAMVANCRAAEFELPAKGAGGHRSNLGYAVFSASGLARGHNPCGLSRDEPRPAVKKAIVRGKRRVRPRRG